MREGSTQLIHEEKTYIIRKGLYAVQNEVGLGKSEETYHKAFVMWLEENKIPYTSKKPHSIRVGNKQVHILYPDIIVWDSILIELKSKPFRFTEGDWVQIYNYMKYRNERLGLFNMNLLIQHPQAVSRHPQATSLPTFHNIRSPCLGIRRLRLSLRSTASSDPQSHLQDILQVQPIQ